MTEDLGEDLEADDWINFVNNEPMKNKNAEDLNLGPFERPDGEIHDDHTYSSKDQDKENKSAEELLDAADEQVKNYKEAFEQKKQEFAEEKKKLRLENLGMQRRLKKAEKDLKDLRDKTSPKGKANLEESVRERLKDHFSEGTLDLILDKTRRFSRKWTNKDYAFAMLLKMISPKALAFLRKSGKLPQPANSTLKKKFSFMYVSQGVYSHFFMS